ncbi:hypothetical protein FB470_006175 [Amycolatopsis thermophila]|uniref:Uncharacterized protein n=1 Tax=Amycolatopsis thermophila TaxID=206084 RepID=A0ABU0F3S2_9PSEU|nr:hypothetical protein [Amycolatopsis thermophila]
MSSLLDLVPTYHGPRPGHVCRDAGPCFPITSDGYDERSAAIGYTR